MVDVRLSAIVTEDHQLTVQLPQEISSGQVEIIIRPLPMRVRSARRIRVK